MRVSPKPYTLLFLYALRFTTTGADLTDAIQRYRLGEYRRAADLLAQKTRSMPETGDLRFWLGKCYLKMQKWDDAVRELERAMAIEPANGKYHLWLGRAYGEKASRASFFTAFGWARKVLKEFETAERLSPGDLDIRFDLLEFYVEAPGIVGGGTQKARRQAEEIARLSPRHGYTARARLYEKEKKWQLARNELTQGAAAHPDDPEGYVDLAEFLLKQMDFEAAADNARKALRIRAALPRARLILSAALVQLRKEIPAAEKTLREMASGYLDEEDPSFAEVYYWLGQAQLAQGKKADARQALESALRFDPDHDKARAALSQIR